MNITNYKEYDEVYSRAIRIRSKMEELNKELAVLVHDLNQAEEDMETYDTNQAALDE